MFAKKTKKHLRYHPPLSLPIFTLLMAMETGQGPAGVWPWQIGDSARQLIVMLGEHICSAQPDKVNYVNWCFWGSICVPFRCLALSVRCLFSIEGDPSIPFSRYSVENFFCPATYLWDLMKTLQCQHSFFFSVIFFIEWISMFCWFRYTTAVTLVTLHNICSRYLLSHTSKRMAK